jgi:hypothetical protein
LGRAPLKGKLAGGKTGGVIVKLELDKTGFLGDKFDGTALTAKTSSNGSYSFNRQALGEHDLSRRGPDEPAGHQWCQDGPCPSAGRHHRL